MKIKIWGCRGSLPTPGMNTIRYGGNTTCIEIDLDDGTMVIVDAGSGIRKLGRELLKRQNITEIYLFFTHAHWDHLMGFPFFTPAYLSKYKIHIRGGPHAKRSLEKFLKHQMEAPYFPVPFNSMKAEFDFTYGEPKNRKIGVAELIPIHLNHPNGGYGFKIIENDKCFVFLTDNELDFQHNEGLNKDDYITFCKDADLIIHDAQYTNEEYKRTNGWGHTTFSSATEMSITAGVKRFGIFHHDPEHTDDDMDRFIASCQRQIIQARSKVTCFGVKEGMEIIL